MSSVSSRMRPHEARQVHLLAGQIPEFEKLRAEAVTFAGRLGQKPALHQRGRQTVRGAARQAKLRGERGQPYGSGLGDHVEKVQAAKKRLAATRRFWRRVVLCAHSRFP